MLRRPEPHESTRLVELAAATGLFTPADAASLLGGVLDDFHAGRLGEGHDVQVWADASGIAGWIYLAPSFKAEGVWDLWWIGVDPRRHRQGVGTRVLAGVEERVATLGGRLLIIETSATPPLEPARRFYLQRGYRECGTIPDFYGEGDDKVIFAKRVQPRA